MIKPLVHPRMQKFCASTAFFLYESSKITYLCHVYLFILNVHKNEKQSDKKSDNMINLFVAK